MRWDYLLDDRRMTNIIVVLLVAVFFFTAERLWPDIELAKVPNWYTRALFFNVGQAVIAFSGTYLWDAWFSESPLFGLNAWPLAYQVLFGYVVITFIYYWWHRARHGIPMLWRFLHQLHHSR